MTVRGVLDGRIGAGVRWGNLRASGLVPSLGQQIPTRVRSRRQEHIDVRRSLGRRTANRSNPAFRFLSAEEGWNPPRFAVSPFRTVNSVLGVGAIVISFVAVALDAVSAFGPAAPMAGAVFVLLGAVLAFCLFIVRSFCPLLARGGSPAPPRRVARSTGTAVGPERA